MRRVIFLKINQQKTAIVIGAKNVRHYIIKNFKKNFKKKMEKTILLNGKEKIKKKLINIIKLGGAKIKKKLINIIKIGVIKIEKFIIRNLIVAKELKDGLKNKG